MKQAREFLSRVLPWPPAGQPGSFMNIHWSFTKTGNTKPLWYGAACTTLDECINKVQWQLNKPETLAIYVCMSSQRMATPKVAKNGGSYMVAQRSLQGAVEHKSFYLDIDVKEGAYPTQFDALQALQDFMSKTGLPMPTAVVGSGSGGMHVHWIVERPMPSSEWSPYANALASAVIQHGLIADVGCTRDAARILRVPNTLNKKSGVAKPVELLCQMLPSDYPNQDIFDKLKPYLGASTGQPAGLSQAFAGQQAVLSLPGVENELSAGISREARPVIISDVAKECGFVNEALQTGGKDFDNHLWNLSTLLATFGENGRDIAHDMAKGHKTYTVEDTDQLFTRKLQERLTRNIGWPQCQTIANSGSKACQSCPHLHAGKSPLHFGRAASSPMPSASDLPAPYFRDANNIVYKSETKEDGSSVARLVSPFPMSSGWIQSSPWTFFFNTKLSSHGEEVQIRLPLEEINGRDGMLRFLGVQGFSVSGDKAKQLGEFFVAWMQELRKIKSSVVNASPFGWLIENGKITGFTYAGKVFTPKGERPASNPDPQLTLQYTPRGDIDPWRAAVKMTTDQQRPELNAILASSFAAPLVRFTGELGALVSAYSIESGIGKTSTMKIAQAVWGDPIRGVQGLDDTNASVFGKIGELKSIPVFWDELKTEDDTAKFVKLAFQVTAGKDKSRLKSDTTMRAVGTWQTMVVVASNNTLLDQVIAHNKQTAAGIYRLFEFVVAPGTIGKISHTHAARTVQGVHDNYGQAGEIYAKFLGENHQMVSAQVAKFMDDFVKGRIGHQDERYWFVCGGTILLGAMYANQLGLTDIDLPALKTFIEATIDNMRQLRKNNSSDLKDIKNVEDTLTQFMSSHSARHTLHTDIMYIGVGRQTVKPKVLHDASRLDGLYIHIAHDTGVMRLAKTKLSEWLKERGHSNSLFMQELKERVGFKEQNSCSLGAGTMYQTHKQYCLEIMTAGTSLQDYIDNWRTPTMPGGKQASTPPGGKDEPTISDGRQ